MPSLRSPLIESDAITTAEKYKAYAVRTRSYHIWIGEEIRLSKGLHGVIAELKNLENDWDGEGGLPIYPEVIHQLDQTLLRIKRRTGFEPQNDDIVPNSNGTVTVTYRGPHHALIINIGRTNATFALLNNDFEVLRESNSLDLTASEFPEDLLNSMMMLNRLSPSQWLLDSPLR